MPPPCDLTSFCTKQSSQTPPISKNITNANKPSLTTIFAIFIPTLILLLTTLALFQLWACLQRRKLSKLSPLRQRQRHREEGGSPHPPLFSDLNDASIGTRVIELADVGPILWDGDGVGLGGNGGWGGGGALVGELEEEE